MFLAFETLPVPLTGAKLLTMIIKIKKRENPFAMIDRAALEDSRLSFKARGVLAYLLAKPASWEVSLDQLVSSSDKDGIDSIRAAFKELKQFGYAVLRTRREKETGKVIGKGWNIYEQPTTEENRHGENPNIGEKPTSGKTPRRRKPDVGKTPTTNKKKVVSNKKKKEKERVGAPAQKTEPDFQPVEIEVDFEPLAPQSDSDVRTLIARANLNGDTPTSRLALWEIYEPYLDSKHFKTQWKFYCAGIDNADAVNPADVMRDWVKAAAYYDVKEVKYNKISGWIRTAANTLKNGKQSSTTDNEPRHGASTVANLERAYRELLAEGFK